MFAANEMSVKEAIKPFTMLAAASNLRIMFRPGGHHGFDDVATYIDFFDSAFGRGHFTGSLSGRCPGCWWVDPSDPATYLTAAGFDWGHWNATLAADRRPPAATEPLTERILWLLALGEYGPSYAFSMGDSYAEESEGPYIAVSELAGEPGRCSP